MTEQGHRIIDSSRKSIENVGFYTFFIHDILMIGIYGSAISLQYRADPAGNLSEL